MNNFLVVIKPIILTMKHPVFILNMPERKDRLASIKTQFKNKKEFRVNIVNPIPDKNPRKSLWLTICNILKQTRSSKDLDYVIICEDDHVFTEDYSAERLYQLIDAASSMNADILLGGVSWQKFSYQIAENLYHISSFTGLQFTVIFKKFFEEILKQNFTNRDIADKLISSLTTDKYLIFPTISSQKEFGYSDVTPGNNKAGRVTFLFDKTNNTLLRQKQIRDYYANLNVRLPSSSVNADEFTVPLYLLKNTINDNTESILKQFSDKDEFEITIFSPSGNPHNTLMECIEKAMKEDEDFFVLFKADHSLTPHYNKHKFIQNIVDAYVQRADLLLGGLEKSGNCYPISLDRYWIDWFRNSSCVIIFKNYYATLLAYISKENESIDSVLTKLSINKMVLYPFISQSNCNQDKSKKSETIETNNEDAKFIYYGDMFKKLNSTLDPG